MDIVKTAENQYEKYTTLRTRQNQLADQRQRLEEKQTKLSDEIRIIEQSAVQANLKYVAAEKKYIRDEITSRELAASKADCDNFNQKLAGVKRFYELATNELGDISAESNSINREISDTLKIYANFIKNDIAAELGGDEKIREKVLEAYAALTIADAWMIRWPGFLSSIFPSPRNDEIKKAVADFRANRKL